MINEELLGKWQKSFIELEAPTVLFGTTAAIELIELAKLGLWAQQYGIPKMNFCVNDMRSFGYMGGHDIILADALEKLPKEK